MAQREVHLKESFSEVTSFYGQKKMFVRKLNREGKIFQKDFRLSMGFTFHHIRPSPQWIQITTTPFQSKKTVQELAFSSLQIPPTACIHVFDFPDPLSSNSA